MTDSDFTVIENEWIPLGDGTHLAARIWMPEGAEADPVPAVLEFLPYRKRDGTSPRDESTYPTFARNRIAGVRVDIRGSGESEGVIDGEYTPLELANAAEVIGWIASRPWCNGSVGMMGISWGGFNCLQTAALRPPALKAVISIASTVDRYNDDIHYKNGCHLYSNLSWAANMLAYQSRSPDPALVGDRWKAMWLERLENEPFFLEDWLAHQRRDAFWKHASICEAFDDVTIPALVIAGWADGYRNTPWKAVEGLGDKAKAIVGPWIHKYPHFAWPKPRADFLNEAVRWWNRWLKGEQNGAENLPQVRAYIMEEARPAPWRDFDPGRWIALPHWSKPEMLRQCLDATGCLVPGDGVAGAPGDIVLKSPLDTGTTSGEYFTLKPDAQMAGDQRFDDGASLCFETQPMEADLELLGQPVLTLRLASDAAIANFVARLVDVHPDGTAYRIAFGVLNLTHRESDEFPAAMPPGEKVEVSLTLDACGYRLKSGHRLRLALSSAYWPMILPPPSDAALTIDRASLRLDLPLLGTHEGIDMPEPADPDPLPKYITRVPGRTERSVSRNLTDNRTDYRIFEDRGCEEHPQTGLAVREVRDETWSISPDDPLSMTGRSLWTCEMERPGWFVRTVIDTALSCTATDWKLSATVTAYDGDEKVSEKSFAKTIARDFM
ncbi:CocE/NonD family hydrolase [Pleomorphomonas sp. JP5]|uniref:CocE/NonD family hydrolase n=1 Tax=Pleomorphomonas sp. JP5 TaxID=2942998 RepID=UPI0020433154|nr:CocE/NonD family hydrolase [Pleomorphomonas sp. JP5]MCM5558230.1 CocE/NonD family hydrolase [Pleomorphomonas sp. JP5]